MNHEFVIEVATFEVDKGVTGEQLLDASRRLEREFLERCDGYLGRILARKTADAWADIVFWRSREHASRAMQMAGENEACHGFFSCMKGENHDNPDNGVIIYDAIRNFGCSFARP